MSPDKVSTREQKDPIPRTNIGSTPLTNQQPDTTQKQKKHGRTKKDKEQAIHLRKAGPKNQEKTSKSQQPLSKQLQKT